ncbi:MAG: hypothetical protein IKU44_05040 [Firmicutes bacterium]|nr:hypothetical protein [Bacillota bacterium]
MMKQWPSDNLKKITAGNLMTAIDNYDYDVKDMDLLYENLKKREGVDEELDDLIFVSMKLAFLEGIKFQRKMEKLMDIRQD